MVRLAHARRPSGGHGGATFQSHLGSISTRSFASQFLDIASFQSHLGSISTSPEVRSGVGTLSSFNPTLVRLAQRARDFVYRAFTGFNPTLVRLALLKGTIEVVVQPSFQSNLGSISTSPAAKKASAFSQFQSHLGSISTVSSCPFC